MTVTKSAAFWVISSNLPALARSRRAELAASAHSHHAGLEPISGIRGAHPAGGHHWNIREGSFEGFDVGRSTQRTGEDLDHIRTQAE